MSAWKLVLEYDGGKYSGWQEQRNARTVQGELRKAAEDFLGAEVDIQGAGRTDAGVHALAQVAHLKVQGKVIRRPAEIVRALNALLPADIVVLSAEPVPGRFHARHDALSRTYLYRIALRKTAFAKRYVWWIKEPLDVPLMARAARMLEGRHDFSCFRAVDPGDERESSIVVVESATLDEQDDGLLFRITASHFVWRMVRRVTGVLVKLGKHEINEPAFLRLLEGRCDPKLDVAAWTAPASGLFLERVRYPENAATPSPVPPARRGQQLWSRASAPAAVPGKGRSRE